MQFWVFFDAGHGGDGLVNLLEHSKNIITLDHGECVSATPEQQFWRVDRVVNDLPKFWAPTPDVNGCFRNRTAFDCKSNKLHSTYVDIVNNNYNTIVTSHDTTLENLTNSDFYDTFVKNQIKIYVYNSNNSNRQENSFIKNLVEYNIHNVLVDKYQYNNVNNENFDFIIDLGELLASWTAMKTFTKELGLTLDEQYFDQFNQILKKSNHTNFYPNTTPKFQSTVDTDGNVTYKRI